MIGIDFSFATLAQTLTQVILVPVANCKVCHDLELTRYDLISAK